MKKVLLGLALGFLATSMNAQQLSNSKGETTAASSATMSRAGAAVAEPAKSLQDRITRVLNLDVETSNKVGEVTKNYFEQKAKGGNLEQLVKQRESKLKGILGDKYATLEEYRAKVKANTATSATGARVTPDNILIQD